ncbi:MAG: adenosylmethionine--8-amino-7-oxononanoate transaminase [Gammaproteobacteria bacterium]|nr:adenosylmethionine--8-amino-7-oxononanoate transaminase [Gammaproteobacteria bacterium]MBU1646894.1 adenosylmethionine--8-amino-7-oxononanoate transaminase [Gammaproteobacteria bacterium]MBU1971155.1 adenosylmethionine--8-amino-7-oxononanoate transaminase [Gammaproteobacteria bacterium]
MPPAATSWLTLDHVWLPYTQMATTPPPLAVVGASGSRIELADGSTLIDGIASWWTACHGYNHPHIRAAVAAQLDTLPHVMFAGLAHEPACTLAARLAALLPGDLSHAFFSESGSVAVEIALKMAVQFWRNQGQDRHRIIAFHHGYHGDTLGALSVTDPASGFHDAFAGYRAVQIFAELPRTLAERAEFERLLAAHRHEVAAVIVEPLVQGAGGMRFHDAATLAFIRAACDRHDVLLIADEIMTGFGRTGRLFACQGDAGAGIVPDLICLSKALTGGTLPLAATVATTRVFDAFRSARTEDAFMHGPTFMANPLACAAANASLDLFEREPRLQQVAAIEGQMHTELEPCRELPGVLDVRVSGAIGVVQLATTEASTLRPAFVERGVWVRPFGDIVYLAPPFTIGRDDLATLTSAVCDVVRDWGRTRG